jgi:aspartate/methionine/tyrosine aminotransferase
MLVDLGEGVDSEAFAVRLLKESGVAVAPGSAFGQSAHARRHVRVAVASEVSVVEEGVRRLCEHIIQERKERR